jgi:hypothetical protein
VNERFDYTCPDTVCAIANIPDNARRVGPGSRAARTSAMSGRQVCGQAPGGSGSSPVYKGMAEQTGYTSVGAARRGRLTSVVLGVWPLRRRGCRASAEPQGRDWTNRDDHNDSIDDDRYEQKWLMCWKNCLTQVGGYSKCYYLPLRIVLNVDGHGADLNCWFSVGSSRHL